MHTNGWHYLPGLSRAYDLVFLEVKDLDPAIMYQAMANREVDVICAFATDGRIAAYDLTPLMDDRSFFPPYQAAPVVREQCLTAYPEVGAALSLIRTCPRGVSPPNSWPQRILRPGPIRT